MKNKRRRRLIYQVKLINKSSVLYDFCIDSVAEYAKHYEIDHIVQTEPILKICPDPKTSGRSKNATERLGYLPIFEKENAFDLLGEYDQILILDADIYIRESAPNVFWALPSSHDFGAVLESEMPITETYRKKILAYSKGQYSAIANEIENGWNYNIETGYDFYNMGMILLNKSFREHHLNDGKMTAEQFLKQSKFKRFVDGTGNWKWSTDQTLLNHFVRKNNVKVKNLDWKWNALYKGIEDRLLSEAYFIHFFLKDHLPDKGENLEMLRKIVNRR